MVCIGGKINDNLFSNILIHEQCKSSYNPINSWNESRSTGFLAKVPAQIFHFIIQAG